MALSGKREEKENSAQKTKCDKLRKIAEAFTDAGIFYEVGEADNLNYLASSFQGENLDIIARVISAEGDISVMSEVLATIPSEKTAEAYAVINEFNQKYKFIKFVLIQGRYVFANCELPQCVPDEYMPQMAADMLFLLAKIVDDAYPEIRKLTQ